jgi:hypothetical protein
MFTSVTVNDTDKGSTASGTSRLGVTNGVGVTVAVTLDVVVDVVVRVFDDVYDTDNDTVDVTDRLDDDERVTDCEAVTGSSRLRVGLDVVVAVTDRDGEWESDSVLDLDRLVVLDTDSLKLLEPVTELDAVNETEVDTLTECVGDTGAASDADVELDAETLNVLEADPGMLEVGEVVRVVRVDAGIKGELDDDTLRDVVDVREPEPDVLAVIDAGAVNDGDGVELGDGDIQGNSTIESPACRETCSVPSPNWPNNPMPQQLTVALDVRAHTWLELPVTSNPPRRTATMFMSAETSVGTNKFDNEPPPNPSSNAPPQQYNAPEMVIKQLAWNPQRTLTIGDAMDNGVGTSASTPVPSPTLPNALSPQQATSPSSSSAQVCDHPAAIVTTLPETPETSVGVTRFVNVPSPIWPLLFQPQQ